MNKTFTQLDLVRFLYHETTHAEAISIATTLEENQELNREFRQMQQAYSTLSSLIKKPSGRSVEHVLRYSTQQTCDGYVI